MTQIGDHGLVSGAELLRLCRMLWMSKSKHLIWAVLGLILGALWILVKPETGYRASALVRFEYNENLPDHANPAYWKRGGGAEIASEIVTLTSAEMLGKLVDHLKLTEDRIWLAELRTRDAQSPLIALASGEIDTTRAGLVDLLSEKLSAKPIEKSYVYEIKALAATAHQAERLANGLAELSIQEAIHHAQSRAERAGAWYAQKAAALKSELDQADEDISAFTEESNFTSERDLRKLHLRAKTLRLSRERLLQSSQQGEEKLASLLKIKDGAAPDILAAMTSDPLLVHLASRAEFDKARFQTRLDQVIAGFSQTNQRHQKQIAAMDRNLAEISAQIELEAADAITLRELKRVKAANTALYENYLTRLKEAVASKDLALSERRIISYARAEPAGAISDLGYLASFAMALLLLSVTWMLVRELTQMKIRQPSDVEEVIGQTPLLEISFEPLQDARKILKLSKDRPDVAIGADWRRLRTILEQRHARSVYLSSTRSSEGKTLTALGLAQSIGITGRRVLIVDCDPFHTGLAEILDLPFEAQGFTNAIQAEEPLSAHSLPSGIKNVDILPVGDFRGQAADYLASDGFRKLIGEASSYDFIIFDGDALAQGGASLVLAGLAEQVLLLVEWDKTSREAVKKSFSSLRNSGADPEVVISKLDNERMRSYGYPALA